MPAYWHLLVCLQNDDASTGDVAAANSAEGMPVDDADAKALREMLKQRDAARRAAEEDLLYEEIPQPDEFRTA